MFPRETFLRGFAHGRCVAGFLAVWTASVGALDGAGAEAGQKQGVTYVHDRVPSQPWSIHIAKIDRTRPDLVLRSTFSRDSVRGLNTLAQQIQALPAEAGQPVAGVNGDFYVTEERNPYVGDPRGLQIIDGELVSAPTDQASFWIDTNGQPQATNVASKLSVTWPDGSVMPLGLNEERREGTAVLYTRRMAASTRTRGGREFVLERGTSEVWLPLGAGREYSARVREVRSPGDSSLSNEVLVLSLSPALASAPGPTQAAAGAILKVSTATVPDLRGVQTAISGGYVLVRDGKKEKINLPQSSAYKYRSVGERHPRSAIGASRDFIYLLEVDGRQPDLSMGMTLAELADYMQKLGCELALNLDGGASATFWMEGRVLNSPCNKFVRPIANGIVVLQKDKTVQKADAR